eukprot:GILK01009975.1.p1 GENE.GILK01009975.1~~GILK01009975.1.p1  ORF type:complete len:184 (-),score=32.92 GILK01009975.1:100-651(-)
MGKRKRDKDVAEDDEDIDLDAEMDGNLREDNMDGDEDGNNADMEEDGGNDDDDDEREKTKKPLTQEELENRVQQERLRVLISNFSAAQLSRYEAFRRAAFPKNAVKKLMSTVANGAVGSLTAIVMGGIAKVYLGELVETAKLVMTEWQEDGPIRPRHLREAYRRMRNTGQVPSSGTPQALFRR